MASTVVEVPVFTETNLGTRIAMALSLDITAGEFKRELESEHLHCFPKLGVIRVNGLMVKQKSHFYHLPESFPIKHAFQGLKGICFIYTDACLWSSSDKPGLSESVAEEVGVHMSNDINVTYYTKPENCVIRTNKNSTKCKRKKRRIKGFHGLKVVPQEVIRTVHLSKKMKKKRKRVKKRCFLNYPVKGLEKGYLDRSKGVTAEESFGRFATRNKSEHGEDWNSSLLVEAPSETFSESVSVSGIIKKYFSHYEEATSSSVVNNAGIQNQPEEQLKARTDDGFSNIQIDTTPPYTAKTPPSNILFPWPTHPSSETSKDKLKRTEVGKRLIAASNYLRISASKKKPAISFCRFRDGKLMAPKSSSLVRSLVYEISDEDD